MMVSMSTKGRGMELNFKKARRAVVDTGRYAGNTYPCPLGDSWWWSPGFGRDDCPEGGFFRRPAPRGDGDGVRTVR